MKCDQSQYKTSHTLPLEHISYWYIQHCVCYRQEAIVAAISEKDAHIALLEMTPNSNQYNIEAVEKLTQEKIQLQKQLSEVVRDRVKRC